ncbi:MAG: glycosyltransferase [Candidatus Taylorbacteria bacterium]|nr:glycosyltransferase [Candidatus Taylorbacteria bacterium]
MNILQINTVDSRGGAAKIAHSLKKELGKRGHKISMFVGRKYSDEKNIKLLNDVRSFSGKVRKKLAYWLANDVDVFSSDHILKTPEFKQADIVHCHNLHSYYFNLGTLKKISQLKPVVWTFHDMWPITAHCGHAFNGVMQNNGFFTCPSLDIFPPIAWHNEKYLESRKDKIYKNSNFYIVTPSKWLAEKVKQSVLKDKPLSVIYNGIDTSVFKPLDKQECRQSLVLPQDKQIILIIAKGGASNPWKGGSYAQEAIKAFIGDSRAFFVDLGGNTNLSSNGVKMVSFVVNQETLAKYYSAADMLLYPSIADNCPLVVLEAMACGLPVVAFKTGGIPELVEHKVSGYIAEYKNADDLETGIKYLLDLPPQEMEKMRQYAINKIRVGFTVEKMTDQYLELYQRLNQH